MTKAAATKHQLETGASMCFPLFAIKNRYKISLYKYTREMQHAVNPTRCRATYCSGVTNIWKDRVIQRDGAFTYTPTAKLQVQPSSQVNRTSGTQSYSDRLPPTPLVSGGKYFIQINCEMLALLV